LKTALVTGATGFIGANLVRVLLERGRKVKCLVRSTSNRKGLDGLDVEICIGDICDPTSLDRAVSGCDEVYHAAAEYRFWSQDPEAYYRSNIDGTRNILDACLKANTPKVVYTSTVGTMGLADLPQYCDERTPMTGDQLSNHYKRSKFKAEIVALGYAARGLPLVIVNPSAPIGAFDIKPTPTGKIVVDFLQGRMPAYMNTGLNIVHVRDVALGHVLAAEKGRLGERYILGNQNMSLSEIFEALAELTGRPKPMIKIPYGVAWLAGAVSTKVADWVTHMPPSVALEAVKMARKHMYFSAAKAVQELGLPQTPVRLAFADAVEWFVGNGYLNGSSLKRVTRDGNSTQTSDVGRAVRYETKAQGQ